MSRGHWWLVIPAIVVAACHGSAPQAERYTCPMHPQYKSDKPGDCPICAMKLVPSARAPQAADGGALVRHVIGYRSPMDPRQTSPTPRKDEMGMDYVPVYADESGASQTPGHATVGLSVEQQQLLGLHTVAVVRGQLASEIRTTGQVVADETRIRQVTARVQGYIERLEADFAGKLVAKGDPLLSIYSPELLATEEELLLAKKSQGALHEAGLPDMVESARARLRLLGVPDSELAALEARGTARRSLTLVAPVSGYLLKKAAVAGGKVNPDEPLFSIVDLSRVWVLADVHENELPRVRVGQPAKVSATSVPGRVFLGRISFIEPTIDDKTRTGKVRIAVDNPKMELRPDQFVDVALSTQAHSALVVPEDAVIDTGARKLVFVALADGRLEPRDVEVGQRAEGRYEVRGGLKEGEHVATGASFLLDSESRLKSAIGGMTAPAPDGGSP